MDIRRAYEVFAGVCILMCGLLSGAFASTPPPATRALAPVSAPVPPPAAREPEAVTVSQLSDYVFRGGVRSQDGRFSAGRAGISLRNPYRFENGLPLEWSFSLNHYFIDDSTEVGIPSSLQSKGISLGTKFPVPFVQGRRFFIGLDSGLYFQTAGGHDFDSDALRLKSRVYGIYRGENRLIFAVGVMVYSGYEDRTLLPFAGFQYTINDRWSLNFLSQAPSIAYRVDDKTTLRWQMGGYRDEFEVVSGGRRGDVVKISEFHASMGIERRFADNIHGGVRGGWAFARKYEYLKNGGKVVPEDGFFIGYFVRAQF